MTYKIINVKKLKKKGMYEVTFQDFNIKVTEDILVKYLLIKDKSISEKTLNEIKVEETKEEIYLKVLNYISYQFRSEYEIRIYLNKHEANYKDKEYVINKLKSYNLINDYALSQMILDSIINNHKGPNKYKEKLFLKGIKEYMEYNSNTEIETLKVAIEKNKDNKSGLPAKKQRLELIRKLVNDGFNLNLIYEYTSDLKFIDKSIELIDKDISKLKLKYSKYSDYELKKRVINGLLLKGYEYSLINEKLNNE